MSKLIDIHIGVTREHLFQDAVNSATKPWSEVHQIRNCTNIYALREIGYSLGTAPYVSYVDDDDILLNTDSIEKELKAGTLAFFTNSIMTRKGISKQLFSDSFTWDGASTYLKAVCPHNPYFVRRDIMLEATHNAYNRILKNTNCLLSGVDFAIACEVELLVGWKYIPAISYEWRQQDDSTSTKYSREYSNIFYFYQKLIEDEIKSSK